MSVAQELARTIKQEAALTGQMVAAIDRAVGSPVNARRIVDILIQRRLLSINLFTWMVDTLLCAMEGDEARDIAIGILREEYAGPNHRYEFLMEIVALGIQRRDVLRRKPSPVTKQVMKRIGRVTLRLVDASELERLIFLRFFGEILPGHEFAHLLCIMQDQQMIEAEKSRFLWPHVNYDVIGHDEALSHADQYLIHIERLLGDIDDRAAVATLLQDACDIRLLFYSQFRD